MSAVRRLRADLDRVQASSDTLVLGREDLVADGLPEDPNDEAPSGMAPSVAVEVDAHHYALASLGLVGKIDPDMIHAPVYSNWPAQYRKLDAAMAPVKLLAARRSVDQHVCPGAFRALCFAASGLRWVDIAKRLGVSDKTAKARTILAVKALRQHYRDEDNRPPFANWHNRGVAERLLAPVSDWRVNDVDGREIDATVRQHVHEPAAVAEVGAGAVPQIGGRSAE